MISSESRKIIYNDQSKKLDSTKTLRILHFNDVYNIEGFQEEPVGGAARFSSALEYFNKNKDCLIAFSGDAVSPSTLSLFSKGDQMIECLNKMNIHAAAVGNHEFDMGLDVFSKLIKRSNFPWVLSNVFDPETSKPIIDVKTKLVYEFNNIKVGLFALAEKEWVSSLSAINFDDVLFEPYTQVSKKLAKELREEDNVDVVIALTHMRWPNDENLAKKVPEIDLILGGHDHEYECRNVNDRWIIKSGADFKEFSIIDLEINQVNKSSLVRTIKKISVDSKVPENQEIKDVVKNYLADAERKLDEELGTINSPLDGRYDFVRTSETNLGNFLCDIIMSSVSADCSMLNGGSLRSDMIHSAGVFRRRDLRAILPFDSELVVASVTGEQLHQLLENCVSKYEEKGGRYPQVSGIFFAFDITKPPGQRIDSRIIKVQNEYLNLEKKYRLATNTFLKNVDKVLKDCPVLISSENIPFLYTLVENYFKAINDIKLKKSIEEYRSQIVPKVIISALMNKLSKDPEIMPERALAPTYRNRKLTFRLVAKIVLKTLKQRKVLLYKDRKIIKSSEKFQARIREYEQKFVELAPKIENRSIKITNEQELNSILNERKMHDLKFTRSFSTIITDAIMH